MRHISAATQRLPPGGRVRPRLWRPSVERSLHRIDHKKGMGRPDRPVDDGEADRLGKTRSAIGARSPGAPFTLFPVFAYHLIPA